MKQQFRRWLQSLKWIRFGGDLEAATSAPPSGPAGDQAWADRHQQVWAGYEREQNHLAHELHDNTVQHLVGINYQLVWLAQQINEGETAGPALAAKVGLIQQEVLSAIDQLRHLIGGLRPLGLVEAGLAVALESYVDRLERMNGGHSPKIELDLAEGEAELPEAVALGLFRVAQEALRNTLKHAQAGHVQVRLVIQPDQVMLSIEDDGCGFNPPARLSELTETDHFGLAGMAERVHWLGGRLTLQSQPGAGTRLLICLPI